MTFRYRQKIYESKFILFIYKENFTSIIVSQISHHLNSIQYVITFVLPVYIYPNMKFV